MKALITDFSYGELSRKLDGRVDLPVTGKGAAELYNMYVTPQGPASTMPGTKYVSEVKDSANKTRLIEMEISEDTAYIIELGNQYIRFYKNGSLIKSGAVPYEIATTYLTADLFDIKYAQIDKNLYIVHPSYPVRKLTWTSDTSWAITDVTFTGITFSTANNYPSVIAFHEGRLILGATNTYPQKIWGSKTLDYDNFTLGTSDADAWEYEIGVSKLNKVLWLVSGDKLTAGTTGSEVSLWGTSGITPTDIQIKQVSTFGSKNIQGQLIGLSLLFIQRAGRKIREFAYQSEEGALASPDLTTYADHITESGVVGFAYQQEPVQCAWFIRSDGYMIGLSFDRSTGLMAWHRHWIGGEIESIAVIPGDTEDMLYVIVKRTINGSVVRYVEYFTEKEVEDKKDWFFLHSGITVDNGSGSAIEDIEESNTNLTLEDGASPYVVNHTLTNKVTIDCIVKPTFAYDIASDKRILRFYLDSSSYLDIRYASSTDKIDLTYNDNTSTRWLTGLQFDDGTSYDRINQRIRITGTLDLTTGTTAGSIWRIEALETGGIATNAAWNNTPAILSSTITDLYIGQDNSLGSQWEGNIEYLNIYDNQLLTVDQIDAGDYTPAVIPTEAGIKVVSTSHGFSTDDYVKISGVEGMTELNDRMYRITVIDADSYRLKDEYNTPVEGTSYTAYTSGGITKLVTSDVSGLGHLEGETVTVYADGGYQGTKVVSSGEITLDRKANKIQIGLPYQCRIKTMRLRPELVGDKKIISKVFIRFYKTIGCKVGPTLDNLQEINFRDPGLDMSAPEEFTGDKEIPYPGSYGSDNYIYVIQDDPLPMTVCAISPEYSTEERR